MIARDVYPDWHWEWILIGWDSFPTLLPAPGNHNTMAPRRRMSPAASRERQSKTRPGRRSATSRSRVRILLVALNPMTQAGYRVLEEMDPELRIGTVAESVEGALEAVTQMRPDLILVDLSDDRLPAVKLIETVVAAHPELRLLAMTAHEDIIEAEQVLLSGAAGYTGKSAPLEETIKAVRAVAAGGNYLEPTLAQRIALQKLMGKSSSLRVLSPREYEIFCMMASDIPVRDIARRLALTYKTVANYSGTIKAKLKIRSRDELKAIAIRHGVTGR
ncbi:MAG: LuxR C-terminal-related transcriptional regulator [Chromatiales bacterium]